MRDKEKSKSIIYDWQRGQPQQSTYNKSRDVRWRQSGAFPPLPPHILPLGVQSKAPHIRMNEAGRFGTLLRGDIAAFHSAAFRGDGNAAISSDNIENVIIDKHLKATARAIVIIVCECMNE